MSKTGFVGTGVVGKSIIRNMMRNDLSISAYSRTKDKAGDLVAEGVVWYDTPKAIAEASDIIFAMVGFPSDVEGVHLNGMGIFQADLIDKIVVDLTISTPTLAERIAKKTAKVGAHALDSPASGGDLSAKGDTLTTMIGGDQESYEVVLLIFKTFGKTFMLHGSAGKGQHTKMANQLMIADTMTGLTEMLVYADATGLALKRVLETVDGGSAANWSLSNYGPCISKEDYTPGSFIKHSIKDLKVALDETKKLDFTLPVTQKATKLYESLIDRGFENDGTQTLIEFWWIDDKQPTNKN